jgi:hypothetical protein
VQHKHLGKIGGLADELSDDVLGPADLLLVVDAHEDLGCVFALVSVQRANSSGVLVCEPSIQKLKFVA